MRKREKGSRPTCGVMAICRRSRWRRVVCARVPHTCRTLGQFVGGVYGRNSVARLRLNILFNVLRGSTNTATHRVGKDNKGRLIPICRTKLIAEIIIPFLNCRSGSEKLSAWYLTASSTLSYQRKRTSLGQDFKGRASAVLPSVDWTLSIQTRSSSTSQPLPHHWS